MGPGYFWLYLPILAFLLWQVWSVSRRDDD